MCQVGVIAAGSNALNIPMRKSTGGSEIKMVKRFIKKYKALAAERSWKHDVLIFVEPKLNTGYPDLLIAHYDPKKTRRWANLRDSLSARDLKILALLMNAGAVKVSRISYMLGFGKCDVVNSLKALEACKLVFCSGGRWTTVGKASFFSLERLVSVEAKTGNAREALEQAFRNTRFSSWSYTLLGNGNMTRRLKSEHEALGIGAIAGESFDEIVHPRRRKVPICYTSLLVNEWVSKQVAIGVASC